MNKLNWFINGGKTYTGLIITLIGVVGGYFNLQIDEETGKAIVDNIWIVLTALGNAWAGVGAIHKDIKAKKKV